MAVPTIDDMVNKEKLIINFTPTGMVPTKNDTPHIPVSINEIVEDVHKAYEVGITMVHLHARNPKTELPDYRRDIYEKIVEGIKKYCPGLPLCISLSGRNFPEFEKRSEALMLQPDLASLTLSSLNFSKHPSINSPDMILSLLKEMKKEGVNPEYEIFDLGMANYFKVLVQKNIIKPPFYVNFIFGNIFTMQPSFAQISAVIEGLPRDTLYSFGGIGRFQLNTHLMAIANGAGVRVGLEDNIYYDRKRKVLATNLALVQRIHNLAEIAEREVMKPEEFGNLGFYNSKRKHN